MLFKNKKLNNDKENSKDTKKAKSFYIFKVLFIILVIIGAYVVFNFVKIFSNKNVKIYEVTTGEIVNVDRHKGFIYRDESIATCINNGYINFYVANAERVNRGAFIYSINDTPSVVQSFELNSNDKKNIRQNIKMYNNNITDYDFSNIYTAKDSLNGLINEINLVKQLENIDIEKEINAKEKGYAKFAGLVSFIIDGYESAKIENYSDDIIKKFDSVKVSTQKKEVISGDNIYKIIKSPEFSIAFDSAYDYDNYQKSNNVLVKFVYENVTTNGRIESFIGSDGKKHFKLNIIDYPEKFIDKRIVEFEIENKKISGYKVPIKSLVSKNCYMIPKTMLEKDPETNEDIFYKVGINGIREKFTCNISKEDNNYYYISIDDTLSKLKYGDVLINRFNDTFSLSEVTQLNGVYNMNKGYAIFKNVDIIDKTNEYAIVKKQTVNGISLYDHICLNANDIKEGDLITS
ncbi:MAG: hypothetical protein IJP71_05110 [Lachnospiraceae bacterium]|nr:hypothetical protein [Lachnospiraceae bacterium]